MTNEEKLKWLAMLPEPDLITETKLSDPVGYGEYYRADTVIMLLSDAFVKFENSKK